MFVGVLFFEGCSEEKKEFVENEKLIVAVSIVPQKTFVKAVCGDLVDVVTLVPAGSSPENYEPTAEIMEKLSDSSVYFSIGVETEEANILPRIEELYVVPLHERVEEVYDEITFPSGERDSHIWLSPKRVQVMIQVILQEMNRIDPENEEYYSNNAQKYIEDLEKLDQEITTNLEKIQNRKFIVYHPAFGYFASDYDLEMYALEDEGHDATPGHLREIIDLAKEENIKVIFYQEEIDSSQSKAFAEEIKGQTIKLSPLDKNYIENLKKMANLMGEVME